MALSIILARALVEAVEAAGGAPEAFLAAADFDGERLGDANDRITLDEYDSLVRAAFEATGDAALGLHMGEVASATTYSVAAYLVTCATNLREAIDGLVRYHRLLSDHRLYEMIEDGDRVTLVYRPLSESPLCRRFGTELTLVGWMRLVQFFGRGELPHGVAFAHPPPAHAAEYRRIFRGLERFDAPAHAVSFRRELLDLPQLHGDRELRSELESQAVRRISTFSTARFRDRVLQHLTHLSTGERSDMDATAAALGVSVRTLRRRLTEEGVRYASLLDSALHSRAKKLLGDARRTMDDIAFELGFSDRTSFHRAFRRWTGTTPLSYRRGASEPPPRVGR